MRKCIITLIVLCFSLQQVVCLENNVDSNINFSTLNDLVNDTTLISQLKADKAIVFYTGYHGYHWCVVYKNKDKFGVLNGKISDKMLDANSSYLDTTRFFQKYSEVFEWGLDSLPRAKKYMSVNPNATYTPWGWGIKIYDKSDTVLEISSEEYYDGMDREDFIKKFSRLNLFLYYLSSPAVREYIPLDNI